MVVVKSAKWHHEGHDSVSYSIDNHFGIDSTVGGMLSKTTRPELSRTNVWCVNDPLISCLIKSRLRLYALDV